MSPISGHWGWCGRGGLRHIHDCHGPRLRAIQMTPAFWLQNSREPNWMAHTEFTLRPRFARTGVVGHDTYR